MSATQVVSKPAGNFPGFVPSAAASEYSVNWLLENGRVVKGAAPGPGGKPYVHFPTGQYDRATPEAFKVALADGKTVPFENDFAPLRVKGFLTENVLNAEVGLTLHPSVYYKLGDIKGDLSNGPVTFHIPETSYWKGDITISLPEHDPELAAVSGLKSFFAKVNWVGLGVNVAKHVLPLLV